jgi:hypothetical protein
MDTVTSTYGTLTVLSTYRETGISKNVVSVSCCLLLLLALGRRRTNAASAVLL